MRFHRVSALGYAVLLAVSVALVVWDVAEDELRPTALVSVTIIAACVGISLWSASLTRRQA